MLASALVKVTGEMSRIPTRDLRKAEAFNAFFFTPALTQGRGGISLSALFSTHPTPRAPPGPAVRARGPARPGQLAPAGRRLWVGLFDTLLGRTKPVRANLDALFALPSAAVTLQTVGGPGLDGRRRGVLEAAGRPAGRGPGEGDRPAPGPPRRPRAPGTRATTPAAPSDRPAPRPPASGTFTQAEDSYGYRWLLLDDPDIEDLVTRVHLANSTLTDAGWGPQLLCSVFGFSPVDGAAPDAKSFFLVYLYKRGTFYPFAPLADEHRDNELELRIKAIVGADLPFEPDLSRWFPLWDAPVR